MENHQTFLDRLRLKVTDHELVLIDWAYIFAKYGHRNQKRDDGTRYFDHLRSTALILIDELQIFDSQMIMAALMHDMLEDSFLLNMERIKVIFGQEVAYAVMLLSLPEMDESIFTSKQDRLEAYHQTILNSPPKVMIIKLCDRLHNLRTMPSCTPEKIKRKAEETREHYVPLIDLLQKDYPQIAAKLKIEYDKALAQLPETV
ncbi:MAG: HD domain-containing protein [Candidatus Buchananbacteria bacterium]|nr:HD domain-containing protein [Candidatus Buchananbacteria bacterium]